MKKRTSPKTKTQFKEAISYIKESSGYIYWVIGLFFFMILIGFTFRNNLTFLNDILKDLISKTEGLNTIEMIMFILQNNLQSALVSMITGIGLGIFPLISIILNGTILGYVLGITYDIAGISQWWRLLPHGIFELPAIFIALGLGIKLGFTIFHKKNRLKEFHRRLYNSINTFLLVILPLLIIAAIIEGILIGLSG